METKQTPAFTAWFDGLRDPKAQSAVAGRIARFQLGLLGDTKSVGKGVSEARIAYGPGYRLYYTVRGRTLIILLVGGDKDSQGRDIRAAHALATHY